MTTQKGEEDSGVCVWVCMCAYVHTRFWECRQCSRAEHRHTTVLHRKPQETEFWRDLYKHSKWQTRLFFKNSMSPMAYMLSIGSLQTPSCSGGGTTLKTKTMFKKRNTFERVSGAFCALSPHCVFQTTTPADSAALALESSTKTITETFPTYFFLSISCFCYASPPLLSSSSS